VADDQAVTSASASSAEGSWDTLKFILSTGTAGGLLYLALQFGSSDNLYIPIGLWLSSLAASLLAWGKLLQTLEDYNLNLLTLSSTWNMLLVAIGGGFLLMGGVSEPLATVHVFLIAGILLFTGLSLISNISKTNLIFGIILTLIQLLISALLIPVVVIGWGYWKRSSDRA
jgi:hypothetical protein